jgi:adenylyltransferase/sulfurtransferase
MSEARLSAAEQLRYGRHLVLPEVGLAGQLRLKAGSVLLIGAGGLGAPAALYLAAAGVGRLGLVDDDRVDASNLQRQVLYGTGDVGRLKVEAAAERLRQTNPEIAIEPHACRFTAANALDLVRRYDVIVDGADNFPTRYLVNDACVLAGRPNVHGSIARFTGQAAIYGAPGGPCYRCLYPEPPPPGAVPSCAEGGVLGVLPGLVGTLQAAEALKLLLGLGESLAGRLLLVDALAMRWRELRVPRDPACPLCGTHPTITTLTELAGYCTTPAAPHSEDPPMQLSATDLQAALAHGTPLVLVDVREPDEWAEGHLPGARHIPLGELPQRAAELDPQAEIVLYCHAGVRSLRALHHLQQRGYTKLRSLTGGIMAWEAAGGEVEG